MTCFGNEPAHFAQFELVSAYTKGKQFLTLRFDPGTEPGRAVYFITGNGSSQSLGWGGSREAAIKAFEESLARNRFRLEHESGARVAYLYDRVVTGDGGEVLPVMTTAELKRRVTEGRRFKITRLQEEGRPSEVVTVKVTQSDDFAVHYPSRGIDTRGNWTWMPFCRSDRLRDAGDGGFVILQLGSGDPWLRYTPVDGAS